MYRSRKYFFHSAMFYLYKSKVTQEMVYCCHIWAVAAHSSLSCSKSSTRSCEARLILHCGTSQTQRCNLIKPFYRHFLCSILFTHLLLRQPMLIPPSRITPIFPSPKVSTDPCNHQRICFEQFGISLDLDSETRTIYLRRLYKV